MASSVTIEATQPMPGSTATAQSHKFEQEYQRCGDDRGAPGGVIPDAARDTKRIIAQFLMTQHGISLRLRGSQ